MTMQRSDFTIRAERGLHLRPASAFTREACRFQSQVALLMNGNRYNGKSVYEVLGMCAVKGCTVSLVTEGRDERAALESLRRLLIDTGVCE